MNIPKNLVKQLLESRSKITSKNKEGQIRLALSKSVFSFLFNDKDPSERNVAVIYTKE